MEKNITVRLTARLFAEEKCYGPGVEQLLKAVEKHRSLRAAAASMSMAYSKAWSIIRAAEQGFGCKLLHSTIGGSGEKISVTGRGARAGRPGAGLP